MNTPISISAIIPTVAKRYGIGKNLDASYVLLQYERIVERLFGRADLSKGAFVKGTILFVYVRSSIVAQEIMMKKLQILEHLNGLNTGIELTTIITKQKKSLSESAVRGPEYA